MKWFIYVIKIYMHNLILWWRNHLIAIQHLLIIYASNHLIHQQHFRHQWVHSSILLSLADLSLIYSCRLHNQSICHATRLISLHTGCIPRDQKICLPAGSVMRNLSISYTIDQSAYQLHALQWRNLCIYWPLNWPIYISAARSAMGESAYQLHN